MLVFFLTVEMKRYASYKPKGPVAKRVYSKKKYSAMPRRVLYGAKGDAKYHDVAESVYTMDTTGGVVHLDVVPQGTGVENREGKAFAVSSVQVRGYIASGSETTNTHATAQLVWDFQPNKALPGLSEIMEDTTPTSLPKRENAGRFKVLRRLTWALSGESDQPGTASGNNCHTVDEYVKMPSDAVALCTGADTTGVIGNRISGALYLVYSGNRDTTAAAQFRVRFRVNVVDV